MYRICVATKSIAPHAWSASRVVGCDNVILFEIAGGAPDIDAKEWLDITYMAVTKKSAIDSFSKASYRWQDTLIERSHSGIFHLLPLGLRVQDKLIHLVDRYMRGLGASRVHLSTISSESLWEQSGRLNKIGSELFRFSDRKEGKYILSPTHEEEITSLVAHSVKSYKNLPLRLYQTTQKYRDELRPRHGLLRGREFVMKDLYTFDYSVDAALETYEEVREAYSQIFIKEMRLPVLVAQASSGDMGGSLSHEYHIPTALGEDHVMSCHSCGYVANEELAESRLPPAPSDDGAYQPRAWRGISKDRKTLVQVWFDSNQASEEDVSTHAIKQVFPDLDSGVEDPMPFWTAAIKEYTTTEDSSVRVINIFDCRLPKGKSTTPSNPDNLEGLSRLPVTNYQEDTVNLLRIREGDACPSCDDGTLKVQKAIELGHTFHLGTRYSEPLGASVSVPARLLPENHGNESRSSEETAIVPIQMGCHGIGISRIIGAVADHLADERGLNWPRVVAPYHVVVVFNAKDESLAGDVEKVYDSLVTGGQTEEEVDAIIDDRQDANMGWKLKDADLVGYPVIVVLGREWKASQRLEVQCRRLGYKELVPMEDLRSRVEALLNQL
ncbi:hypothetical protein J7T55_008896 [Diaporthe amygdali]|uniref:uncharacterized protein n=1 Tax=Phomopsis amygdali TaxID=1214568 RepID=UPI0022FEF380|nr:uncharacterized protein J7T55_008896 [Diaporthe amygdali]KAJ0121729.1 hypothetical protein J7T55_008896 [Diaporthe amygdali]